MIHEQIKTLHQEYMSARGVKLGMDQFVTLLSFFPAISVIASDGVVDKSEWEYCNQLANGMGSSFFDDNKNVVAMDSLKNLYLQELKFLIEHMDTWQEKFTSALRKYLLTHRKAKTSISKMIYSSAEISDKFDYVKRDKIRQLESDLNLPINHDHVVLQVAN